MVRSTLVHLLFVALAVVAVVGVAVPAAPLWRRASDVKVEPATFLGTGGGANGAQPLAAATTVALPAANVLISAAVNKDGTTATRFGFYDLLRGVSGTVAKSATDAGAFELTPYGAQIDCAFGDNGQVAYFCVWDAASSTARVVVIDAPLQRAPYVRYVINGVSNDASQRVDAAAAVRITAAAAASGSSSSRFGAVSTHAVFALRVGGGGGAGSQLLRISLSNFATQATSPVLNSSHAPAAVITGPLAGGVTASEATTCAMDTSRAFICVDTETLAVVSATATDLKTAASAQLVRFVAADRLVVAADQTLRLWRLVAGDQTPRQLGGAFSLSGGFQHHASDFDHVKSVLYVAARQSSGGNTAELYAVSVNKGSLMSVYEPGALALSGSGSTNVPGLLVLRPGSSRRTVRLLEAAAGRVWGVETVGLVSRTATESLPRPPPPSTLANATSVPVAFDFMAARPVNMSQIGLENTTRMGLHIASYVLASLPSIAFAPTIAFSVMRGVRLDALFCRGGRSADASIRFFPAALIPTLSLGGTVKGTETRASVIVYCAAVFGLAAIVAFTRPWWSSETGQENFTAHMPGAAAAAATAAPASASAAKGGALDDQEMKTVPNFGRSAAPAAAAAESPTGKKGKRKTKKQKKKELEEALLRQRQQEEAEEQRRRAAASQNKQKQKQAAAPSSPGRPPPPRPRPFFSYVGVAIIQTLVPWSIAAGYLFGIPELTGQALAVLPFAFIIGFFVLFAFKLHGYTRVPSMRTLRVAPAFVVRQVPIEKATREMLEAEKLLGGSLGSAALVGDASWEVPVPATADIVDFYNCARLLFAPFWGPLETSPAILATGTEGATITDNAMRVLSRHFVLLSGTAACAIGIMMGHSEIDRSFCPAARIAIVAVNIAHALLFLAVRPYIVPLHNVVLGTVEVFAALTSLMLLAGIPDIDAYDISPDSSQVVAILEIVMCAVSMLAGLLVLGFGVWGQVLIRRGRVALVNPTRRHLDVASNNLLAFLTLDFGSAEYASGADDDPLLLPHHANKNNNNNNSNNNNNGRGGGNGGFDDDDDDDDYGLGGNGRGGGGNGGGGGYGGGGGGGGGGRGGGRYDDDDDDDFGGGGGHNHYDDDSDDDLMSSKYGPRGGGGGGRGGGAHDAMVFSEPSAAPPAAANPPPQTRIDIPLSSSSSPRLVTAPHLAAVLPPAAPLSPAEQKRLRFHEFLQRKAAEEEARQRKLLGSKYKPPEQRRPANWIRDASPYAVDADLRRIEAQLEEAFRPGNVPPPTAAAAPAQSSGAASPPAASAAPSAASVGVPVPDRLRHLSRQQQQQPQQLYGLTSSLENLIDPRGELPSEVRLGGGVGGDDDLGERIGALLTADEMARAERDRAARASERGADDEFFIPELRKQMIRLRAFFNRHGQGHKTDAEVEQAAVMWAGRYDEMWRTLESLYGPEEDEPPLPAAAQWQMRPGSAAAAAAAVVDLPDSSAGGSPQSAASASPRVASSSSPPPQLTDALTAERVENAELRNRLKAMEEEMTRLRQKSQQRQQRGILDSDDDDDDDQAAASTAKRGGQQQQQQEQQQKQAAPPLASNNNDDDDDDDDDLDTEVMSYDAVLSYLGANANDVAKAQKQAAAEQQRVGGKQKNAFTVIDDDDAEDSEFLPAVKQPTMLRREDDNDDGNDVPARRPPWHLL